MTFGFNNLTPTSLLAATGVSYCRQLLSVIGLCILAVCNASCRKQTVSINGQSVGSTIDKIKAKAAKNLPDAPKGAPIELPNALIANRTHYQTRSVVTLKIESNEVSAGAPIRLLSETTLKDLLSGIAGSLGLQEGSNDAVGQGWDTQFLSDDSGFILRLYPTDPAIAGGLAYGENKLKLLVDETTVPKMAVNQIYLQDFPYVTMSLSAFDTPMQQQGGFQAQVDYITESTITNGTYQLTTGSVGLPNW